MCFLRELARSFCKLSTGLKYHTAKSSTPYTWIFTDLFRDIFHVHWIWNKIAMLLSGLRARRVSSGVSRGIWGFPAPAPLTHLPIRWKLDRPNSTAATFALFGTPTPPPPPPPPPCRLILVTPLESGCRGSSRVRSMNHNSDSDRLRLHLCVCVSVCVSA